MQDARLLKAITQALLDLEKQGDIVVTTSAIGSVAEVIAQNVLKVVPSTEFSNKDMSAITGLLIHLTSGVLYCDEDLPAVTGASLEDFRNIVRKLPLPE